MLHLMLPLILLVGSGGAYYAHTRSERSKTMPLAGVLAVLAAVLYVIATMRT